MVAPPAVKAPKFELGIYGNGGNSQLSLYDYGQGHGWAELNNGEGYITKKH